MISIAMAVFCTAAADCIPVNVQFLGVATPAACERAIADVTPDMTAQGYTRADAPLKCVTPNQGGRGA